MPPSDDSGVTSVFDLFGAVPASLPRPRRTPPATPAAPTKAQLKLMAAAEAIALTAGDDDAADRAFMARQLVQCTLPHTNPGNVPQWSRKCHNVTLGIQPGRDFIKNVSVGYPYGSLPRLLLFWLNTEAVRTKSRRLQLGRSLTDFMRELGLDPTRGGVRSDAARFRDQMRRLFAASISFQERVQPGHGHGGGERWMDMKVAPKGELWWDVKTPQQGGLWESWVELGESFFQAITASPVPVDMRALRALKRSPLALDLYAWATYSTYTVTRKGEPRFIPWRGLAEQFGAEYRDVKNFKQKAAAALRKVKRVYPSLTITPAEGGFFLHPSQPAVPRSTRHR